MHCHESICRVVCKSCIEYLLDIQLLTPQSRNIRNYSADRGATIKRFLGRHKKNIQINHPRMWHKKAREAFRLNEIVIGEYETEDKEGSLKFYHTQLTDFYRKGKPYRLLGQVGLSKVEMKFDLEKMSEKITLNNLQKVQLIVNHCRTSANAIVKLELNNKTMQTIADASRPFGVQKYTLTTGFVSGVNVIQIVLAEHSPGVYWFSDARLVAFVDPQKT